MREILFRGKRVDNGEWVYGDLSQHKTGKVFIKSGSAIHSYEVIPETVGQYTGLTDKNGKKIFEGDIVKDQVIYLTHLTYAERGIETKEDAEEYKNYGKVGVVEFDTENVASCGCCYEYFIGTGFKAKEVNLHKCEVIGNVHDNPELLEENNENKRSGKIR